MSVRDIQSHLERLYGTTSIGRDTISRITDAVIEDVKEWRHRPLESVYPIVYMDALVVKVRQDRSVTKRVCYLVMGVTVEGERDVLGLWCLSAGFSESRTPGSRRQMAGKAALPRCLYSGDDAVLYATNGHGNWSVPANVDVAIALYVALALSERRHEFAAMAAVGGARSHDREVGVLLAVMLIAILQHVFDPPPDTLAIPRSYLGALPAATACVSLIAVLVTSRQLLRIPLGQLLLEQGPHGGSPRGHRAMRLIASIAEAFRRTAGSDR